MSKEAVSPKVLIADDDADTLVVMKHLFEKAGAQVQTVENGKLAVSAAAQGEFDLIILDYRMPELNGITAAGEIREKGYVGTIVIATVTPSGAGRTKSKEIGVNAYFDKRFLKPAVVEALLQDFTAKPVSA